MVLYIILAIIIIILIAAGVLFYMRSNKSQIIEKAETRKTEVAQLPYEDSVSRLSELELTGEIQEKHDQFKQLTLESETQYLAPVEEKLHDAETYLDKFKFSQAQSEVDEAHELMDKYEANYRQINEEIDEILTINQNSDQLYEQSKTQYREMKRDVLANRHQYGEAAEPLEEEIDGLAPELEQYESLKEEGNYLEAHEHIKNLKNDMTYLRKDMSEIPSLIKEAQKELPGQFQDLKYGCRDLKVEGYDLDHVKIDSTLQTLKTELSFVEPMISRLELDEADSKLNSINDRLDEMYDLIEHEINAKNTVEETKETITDNLFRAKEMNYTLQTEIDYVRENYYIDENDLQNVRQFENEIQNLISVYDEILKEMAKSAVRYSEVEDNLEYIKEHVDVINDKQEKLQNHLIQLREDESEAEDSLLRIQSKKEEVYRKLLGSNLPSVPERFIIMKNEIDYEVREINKKFDVRPLHVQQLKDKVSKAVVQMNKFEEEATDVLVNAAYAEKLIQYGNRYRKDYSSIDKSLNEAERLFKNNRYKRSIEIAEQALEDVEPGVTKDIEAQVTESQS
ncbi:septation ring formation regulator [Staphylococcus auricularis]|uniref:Septation ring formation regulator EzrA n=1 Tax=Staphylococcus auricularis TaxID=29379 RepID=A0AAP8TT05_9STAP|nr:septation ring formation regulator EzrA [Staphylococcus auricularis]MBM0868114.1 septation ring formation regulator EzrA [Staphylococcus auricularis]MCG7340889.1 septation ring formation regulator EzrA [Staphylococcus auricularis]PNZ67300.1 septation ring formation regulator EzrA [Staphylococcus auricularis]QPT06971.1 septation ring formation regulator EzrA [Staphylococcus auricularis]SQJ12612.1 septation ring formation regulator EzrA [Staphylococcus auricularis]